MGGETGPRRSRKITASAKIRVAPRWRSPMWSAQAEAEGLTLLVAKNKVRG